MTRARDFSLFLSWAGFEFVMKTALIFILINPLCYWVRALEITVFSPCVLPESKFSISCINPIRRALSQAESQNLRIFRMTETSSNGDSGRVSKKHVLGTSKGLFKSHVSSHLVPGGCVTANRCS